jgi:hypothetical protein
LPKAPPAARIVPNSIAEYRGEGRKAGNDERKIALQSLYV